MIDELKFDQQFLATLSLIGCGADAGGLVHLPPLHGRALDHLHRRLPHRRRHAPRAAARSACTTACTSGPRRAPAAWSTRASSRWSTPRWNRRSARSPWCRCWRGSRTRAPEKLKATYFAVMASFTNLALSASQLGTKYLNQAFVVTREVRDPASKAVKSAGRLQPPGRPAAGVDRHRLCRADDRHRLREVHEVPRGVTIVRAVRRAAA